MELREKIHSNNPYKDDFRNGKPYGDAKVWEDAVDFVVDFMAQEGYGKMIESTKWVQVKGKYFNNYEELKGKIFEPIKDD